MKLFSIKNTCTWTFWRWKKKIFYFLKPETISFLSSAIRAIPLCCGWHPANLGSISDSEDLICPFMPGLEWDNQSHIQKRKSGQRFFFFVEEEILIYFERLGAWFCFQTRGLYFSCLVNFESWFYSGRNLLWKGVAFKEFSFVSGDWQPSSSCSHHAGMRNLADSRGPQSSGGRICLCEEN